MEDLSGDWRRLDERIEHITKEIEVLAGTDVNCGQLMTVSGIGPIVASATVAARAPPASPCGSCGFAFKCLSANRKVAMAADRDGEFTVEFEDGTRDYFFIDRTNTSHWGPRC